MEQQKHGNTAFRKVARMLHVEQTLELIHTHKVWMLRGQVSMSGSTAFEGILKKAISKESTECVTCFTFFKKKLKFYDIFFQLPPSHPGPCNISLVHQRHAFPPSSICLGNPNGCVRISQGWSGCTTCPSELGDETFWNHGNLRGPPHHATPPRK